MPKHAIEDFDQVAFSNEIRDFMKKYEITTRQFPKIMKTPYTSFCRIERKDHGLKVKTVQTLITAMEDYRRMASSKKS
jgi:predicted transcriptional regulator